MSFQNRLWTTKEMIRNSTLEQLIEGKISAVDASRRLDLSERQIWRLKKRFKTHGAESIIHRNKNRSPANATSKEIRDKMIEVFLDWKRKTDDGLNASHFRDVLEEEHGISISRSTAWRLLKTTSLFTNTRKVKKHRKRRNRREREGDVLYLDGSPHKWFGEKYPKCTLLLCTDDATSKALWAKFVQEENRNGCFEVAYEVFSRFGLPNSFWLDRASQFITTRGDGEMQKQTVQPTHWQDAMYALGVRLIFANSPQARGRGERANGTFQDRLATELQYRNIRTLEGGTKYLNETFIPDFNKRFSVNAELAPAWRKVSETLDLKKILSARDKRRVLNDNTVKHEGIRYQLLARNGSRGFQRDEVEVQEWFDGSMHIIHPKYGDLKYESMLERRKDNALYYLTKSLKQRPDIFPAT